MDAGKDTAVTLFYHSTAFDTIDHSILLGRLDEWFGDTGKALAWFKSHLTRRCRRIKLGDCLSSKADLKFGVPQGSLFGPPFSPSTPLHWAAWSMDTLSLTIVCRRQPAVCFLCIRDSAVASNGFQSCLASIQLWMSRNKLILKPDETEFLIIGNEW